MYMFDHICAYQLQAIKIACPSVAKSRQSDKVNSEMGKFERESLSLSCIVCEGRKLKVIIGKSEVIKEVSYGV